MLLNFLKTKVILSEISKQNPELLGIRLANMVDTALDDSLGDDKSFQVEKLIAPFAQKLTKAFITQLTERK